MSKIGRSILLIRLHDRGFHPQTMRFLREAVRMRLRSHTLDEGTRDMPDLAALEDQMTAFQERLSMLLMTLLGDTSYRILELSGHCHIFPRQQKCG